MFVFSALLIYACLANIIKGNLIVETKSGRVAGKEVNSIIPGEKYISFLGIPFAEPPIGALRFKPPIPHATWSHVLENKKEKKPCAQFNLPARSIKEYGFCGDEDCLYLSIHTPKPPGNGEVPFPVIVFLQNENFKISFNGTKDYSPDFFMKENVIIVMVNHRLGAFGFIAFDDLTLPGNNGLRDVILALQWLQDNIVYFGGDPKKVTLMGNQGGAVIADILMRSPKAKGLFATVIMQSGTSWNPLSFGKDPAEKAISLTENLENKATTSESIIERLSKIPADKITSSELLCIHPDESRMHQRGVLPFGPVIEPDHPDAIITKFPEENTDAIDIPLMIGYNSRESIENLARFLEKPNLLSYADRDFIFLFPIRTGYRFQIHDDIYYQAIDEIKEQYFEEAYVKVSKPGEYLTYMDDVLTIYPIDYTVRSYVNISNAPIYYYMFDFSGELNHRKKLTLNGAVTLDGTWGATVGDDLCHLFVCNAIKKIYKELLADDDSDEIKVLQRMVNLYANFARNGNPTPDEDFTWKPVTKDSKDILVISEELNMLTNLYDDKVNFWDNFLAKYKAMAVDGVIKDNFKDEL